MKMGIGQGGTGSTPFPTPAGVGLSLALGHLLAFFKTAVFQERALSELTCSREFELEQYRGVKNIWVYSSKRMCCNCPEETQVWTPLTDDASEKALLGLHLNPDWYAINQTIHQLKQRF